MKFDESLSLFQSTRGNGGRGGRRKGGKGRKAGDISQFLSGGVRLEDVRGV